MVRTQIQLPDDVYQHAKRLAEAREISMTELVRRGLELILSQYPPPEEIHPVWHLPAPRHLGWRGLSDAEIKDIAQTSEAEEALLRKGR
ncbi:MAG TPA: hypothetical protein PLG23_04960 [Thermoflexales bacterium]|jgi:hypothetical protein|nr:antitoxin [Anaerolineae bacterium]HQV27599.1 hypothetical protein [Thermoflexales bacterium]HQX10190.1 hypothetical protein [Thermoflexales bacterium]HQY23953.1 hypothetical protein [Thermoflexales bacterium]HQZ52789.1 hypothetical protein [Thermoflexales bacterium]